MSQTPREAKSPSEHPLLRHITVSDFWGKYNLRSIQPTPAVAPEAGNVFDAAVPLSSLRSIYQINLETQDAISRVQFYETADVELMYQKKSTADRPRAVAIRSGHASENRNGTLQASHWSTVELIVDWTDGPDDPQLADRVRRCLSLLMMARPDLVVGQAIGLGRDDCAFFFAEGGSGIVYTKVAYADPEFSTLLLAFLHRSLVDNTAMLDPSTRRHYVALSNSCTFDITLPDSDSKAVVYPGYRLRYSYSPFERRTHVFVNTSTSVKLVNGHPARVIKDQWLRSHSKVVEKDILAHVHAGGRLPGATYSPYSAVSDLGVGRVRLRVVMDQCGDRFMRISTIKQGLCLIYDLLEVTRFLYNKRGVLHRDISIGNVMISPTYYEPQGDLEKAAFSSLRFSASFLDQSVSQWKTELLLIDFGCGEIISDRKTDESFEPVGTPLFMARALEKGTVNGLTMGLFPMFPPPPDTYEELCPDRVLEFPESEVYIRMEKNAAKTRAVDKHLLLYDAESILWLLIYWLLFVEPAESEKPEEHPSFLWRLLNSNQPDDRTSYLSYLMMNDLTHGLHSELYEIRQLLNRLARRTVYNPQVVDLPSDDPVHRPDYQHEAFQRIILDFIMVNEDKEFMNRPIRCAGFEDLRTLDQDEAHESVVPSKRGREEEPEPTPLEQLKDDAEKDNLELPQPPPRKRSRLGAERSRSAKAHHSHDAPGCGPAAA